MIARLRAYRPADPAWVVEQHGRVYSAEHGFDDAFRRSIGDKLRRWLGRADPLKQMWIAECADERAGSIAISDAGDATAFLNFVLVLPGFRGRRIGRQLMDAALDHACRCGQRAVRLETYQCLQHARRLYRDCGFRLVEAQPPVARYGLTLVSEFWQLEL